MSSDVPGDPQPGEERPTPQPDGAPLAGATDGSSAEAAATQTALATNEASAPAPDSASDPASHRFECRSCGFVYDPAEGVRSRVVAFKDIGPRNKPSGFEENLNFGLGVNRLTPGQKNVLIFGGFALAIAFFLSLYSLR